MRFALAGIILLSMSTVALAQAEGAVQSIGFAGWYRPTCWVPMKITLRSKLGTAETYRIQVIQEDLDRDRVSFSRPFTLNASTESRQTIENVWVYFRASPRDMQAATPDELGALIRIFLCKGDKQLVQIPFTPGIRLANLDGVDSSGRGKRLVVGVVEAGNRPSFAAYDQTYGLMEDIAFVPLTPNELPTNPLGFEAVDDVVWTYPDPLRADLDAIGAISDWVKSGGRLTVCQGVEWQKMRDGPLAPMLPVVPTGMGNDPGAGTLRELGHVPDLGRALAQDPTYNRPANLPANIDPWSDIGRKEVPVALAVARPGARVDKYCLSHPKSPYLARWMYGQGSVTWVAQDLGSPAIQSNTAMRLYGWCDIWDAVLGLNNRPSLNPALARQQKYPDAYVRNALDMQKRYPMGPNYSAPDPSRSFLGSTEIRGRAAALISLALLFFIGYWLVACLGSYFFLLSRKRAQLSWFAFAVCAIGAGALTALFVKLVLRGPPELQHVSFVRASPTTDTHVVSEIGLLVKQDGRQTLEVKGGVPQVISTLTPLPLHPRYVSGGPEYIGYLEYDVPVPERASNIEPKVTVPFRSTLKKFQVDWTGSQVKAIDGRAVLRDSGLTGKLVNNTGHDLYQVYFCYNRDSDARDDVLFSLRHADGKPAWAKGTALDLAAIWQHRHFFSGDALAGDLCDYGLLNTQWMKQFGRTLGSAEMGGQIGDREVSFVVLSLYDRLEPTRAVEGVSKHYDIQRFSGRFLDISHAVAAGQMVVLARADDPSSDVSPLPFPFEVDGTLTPGSGAVYDQFIVPMDRIEPSPATQPATRPATRPGGDQP